MPKSFADKESQIQYFLMVCKMRRMTVKEIHSEMCSTLKIDISVNSLYNRLERYEEINAKYFNELKKSNHAYTSRMMEIVNHFSYYRKLLLSLLYDQNNKQIINNPSLVFKMIDILQQLDKTEFSMLERIPDIFSWKKFTNQYLSTNEIIHDEKSIDEYVLSLEQIPIPDDLHALQSKIEDENMRSLK